jgi:prepilin peptidase CpaA
MLFLPLYIVRAMGAGDVKLLAMVGAFLGPGDTFYAALASMVVGGALSILFVLVRGTARRLLYNLGSLFQHGLLSVAGGSKPNLRIGADVSAGKLPYGVAIAIGTIGYLITDQLGFL